MSEEQKVQEQATVVEKGIKNLFKNLYKDFKYEVVLAVVGIVVGYIFVYNQADYLSMLGRKVGLFSLMMLLYYISSFTKFGKLNLDENDKKKLNIAILIAAAIVIAFG